jgi:hypothetical protein
MCSPTPQRVGDNREGRIDGSDGRKEARIRHVQIINPMSLAVEIEDRLFWIGSEPQCAGLRVNIQLATWKLLSILFMKMNGTR